jgi:hypothetical protein
VHLLLILLLWLAFAAWGSTARSRFLAYLASASDRRGTGESFLSVPQGMIETPCAGQTSRSCRKLGPLQTSGDRTPPSFSSLVGS